MKNLFLLSAIIISLGFAACNETYTCECKGGFTGEIPSKEIKSRSQGAARYQCESFSNEPGTPDGITCKLKETE